MTAVELFCGAGGSALGVAARGYSNLYCFDNDPEALGVITANYKIFERGGVVITSEGRNLLREPFLENKDIDLLIAGPPCQPFSFGGKRFGFSDIRNGFGSVRQTIKTCKPKVFIIENVEGITAKGFESEMRSWLLSVAGTHKNFSQSKISTKGGSIAGRFYNLHWTILNSADFGSNQSRRRWILVGIRSDLSSATFQWPSRTHSYDRLYFNQVIDSSYWKRFGLSTPRKFPWLRVRPQDLESCSELLPWKTCRDLVSVLPSPNRHPPDYTHHRFGHYSRQGARSYVGHTGSWVDFPSKTIKAGSHGVPGGENMLRFRNGRLRYMTLLECALLQGFPADYVFHGTFNSVVRMIGNACPPILISKILDEIENLFESKQMKKNVSLDGVGYG